MIAHCNVVKLDEEASRFVKGKVNAGNIGKPILPATFGGSSHYGICDLGTSINVISYEFYVEIENELHRAKTADIDMTIMLADKSLRIPMGLVKDASIRVGVNIFPTDLIVVDMPTDYSCSIFFGRTFLNTTGAFINCKEEIVILKFGEERMKFHFSKFEDKPNKEEQEEPREGHVKSITKLEAVYFGEPIDELAEDSDDNNDDPVKVKKELNDLLNVLESPMNDSYEVLERKGYEELPPPKLKPFPQGLKYQFLEDTNKYLVIVSTNLSGEEEDKLMTVLKKHRKAFGYSMDNLKRISPTIATHRIFLEEGAQPVAEFQRRLKPQMKEV
jgi:hypothetical protein